jgi:hypothetical protein
MDVRTIYEDLIDKITTSGTRTTSCLAAATIVNLYGIEGLNALEDAGLITYAGQNSNNYAIYVIA